MKSHHLILVLVSATVVMQGTLLYNQRAKGKTSQKSVAEKIRTAPPGMSFDLANAPTEGEKTARVALIEFSDYQCPFCARHSKDVGEILRKKYVQTGKILHAFANNPLPIHSAAKLLAASAICAGEQDRYWKMHDLLFEAPPTTRDEVISIAQKLSLKETKFQSCMDDPQTGKRIDDDITKAKEFGLTGTPGFAIGTVDHDGHIAIGKFLLGALPADTFEKALDEELAKVSS